MNLESHGKRFEHWLLASILPASLAAARGARHWLIHICAASQMADLEGLPADEEVVDSYLAIRRDK